MTDVDRLWAELSQLRVELRRISTQQIRSELTGAQTDINDLESDVAALPLGVLGYAEVNTTQSGISTETDLTGMSVTVTVPAGRRVKVTGHGQAAQITTAGIPTLVLHEDGVSVHDRLQSHTMAANDRVQFHGSWIGTPSSGSHTYKLRLSTSSGTVNWGAAATIPAYILVEDIGAA